MLSDGSYRGWSEQECVCVRTKDDLAVAPLFVFWSTLAAREGGREGIRVGKGERGRERRRDRREGGREGRTDGGREGDTEVINLYRANVLHNTNQITWGIYGSMGI